MLATGSGAMASLSLWIIVLSGGGVCARRQHGDAEGGDGEETWSETVSRARCASRCLSLHSVAALSTPLQVGSRSLTHGGEALTCM